MAAPIKSLAALGMIYRRSEEIVLNMMRWRGKRHGIYSLDREDALAMQLLRPHDAECERHRKNLDRPLSMLFSQL
jgi:hypothetical protein